MRLYQDEGSLEVNFKINDSIHKRRIVSIIQNDSASNSEFQYLTTNQARMIIQRKVKDQKTLDKLMESVEDKCLTGF